MSDADPQSDSSVSSEPAAPTPDDVRCIRCGYALTALPVAGDCPECGTAIRLSLAGDRIVNADPGWLDRLVRGLRLLHLGMFTTAIAFLAVLLITVLGTVAFALDWDLPFWDPIGGALAGAISLAIPLGAVMAVLGGVFVTAADARDAGREGMRDARPLARWGLGTAVSLGIVAFALDLALPAPHDRIAAIAVLTLATAAGGAGLAALHARLRQISVRIPSRPLADQGSELEQWYRSKTRIAVVALAMSLAIEVLEANQVFTGPFGIAQFVRSIINLVVMLTLLGATLKLWRLAGLAAGLRTEIRQAREAAAVA